MNSLDYYLALSFLSFLQAQDNGDRHVLITKGDLIVNKNLLLREMELPKPSAVLACDEILADVVYTEKYDASTLLIETLMVDNIVAHPDSNGYIKVHFLVV